MGSLCRRGALLAHGLEGNWEENISIRLVKCWEVQCSWDKRELQVSRGLFSTLTFTMLTAPGHFLPALSVLSMNLGPYLIKVCL